MSNNNEMPRRSVLLSSESIFENMQKEGVSPLPDVPIGSPVGPEFSMAKSPDISRVELQDNFINEMLSQTVFAGKLSEEKIPVKKAIAPAAKKLSLETKLESLIKGLGTILMEVKGLVSEMTTAGMLGTNQKFQLGKKVTKNGSNKPCKGSKNRTR